MNELTAAELDAYLARELPISAALGIEVVAASARGLRLRAPLAPNRNPHGTAFGGSLATIALLAAWAAVYRALKVAGVEAQFVVQHSECAYLVPVRGELQASARLDDEAWQTFVDALRERGRARIEVAAEVESEGRRAVAFRARFAARRYDSDTSPEPRP